MPISALTLLVGWHEGERPVKTEWWCAGMVICLQQCADLHMAQLMPLPLTVCCFSKIQICFTFLVPGHLGSPGQRAVKCVCVCVCVCALLNKSLLLIFTLQSNLLLILSSLVKPTNLSTLVVEYTNDANRNFSHTGFAKSRSVH